jgi:integrase
LGKLTPEEIDSFTVKRLEKSIDQKHTSGSTRNVLELLRRIINFGVKNKLCSPLDFVIKLPKVESERIEVLTDEQFKALAEAWNEYPDKHIVNLHKVIAWTGMRPSEPCSLKWDDVDFKHSVIMKRNTKSGKDKPLRMSKEVTTIMMDQRTLLESEASNMRNSAFVFPRRDGGKRNPDGWRKNVKEICIRAGIPKSYRPNYCLRDTIASTMLSNDLTLDQVGYMLGHEPGSPMMKRYAKFVKGEQQRIVDRTNEMMKNKFQSQKEVIDIELYRTNNSA